MKEKLWPAIGKKGVGRRGWNSHMVLLHVVAHFPPSAADFSVSSFIFST